MSATVVSSPVIHNTILASLPPEALLSLLPHLTRVPLNSRESLYLADEPIDSVYFIETGMISLVATLGGGFQAEVGIIGKDGMLGMPLVAGVGSSFVDAMVQIPGQALRMNAAMFLRKISDVLALRLLLLRYGEAHQAQISQTAACNGRHGLEERLARWLLMAHDCVDGDVLAITQDFLSMMLGVHRPSVTVAAGILQRAGLIRYAAGLISVLDRPKLEAASCECYGRVRRRVATVLNASAPAALLPIELDAS